jgi:hypothetical protein
MTVRQIDVHCQRQCKKWSPRAVEHLRLLLLATFHPKVAWEQARQMAEAKGKSPWDVLNEAGIE